MTMFGFTRDRTEDILRKYLDSDFFVASAGKDAPSKSQLLEVAKRFGCKLPKEFITHSTGSMAGIYVEVKEGIWPRPRELEVGPFWTFLYAVHVYGLGAEIPDWMNLELAAEEFQQNTGHKLLPCLKVVGDADIYCFDAEGRIVQWDHETDELQPFDGDFFALLEQEIRELRKRKDQKIAQSSGA
jgi:hypothetical protein